MDRLSSFGKPAAAGSSFSIAPPAVSVLTHIMGWAWFYLTTCVIIWGWTFVFTKVGLKYVSPVELLGLRFAIGVPLLLGVTLFKRLRFDFDPKDFPGAKQVQVRVIATDGFTRQVVSSEVFAIE